MLQYKKRKRKCAYLAARDPRAKSAVKLFCLKDSMETRLLPYLQKNRFSTSRNVHDRSVVVYLYTYISGHRTQMSNCEVLGNPILKKGMVPTKQWPQMR
jgi:hypothetical protein